MWFDTSDVLLLRHPKELLDSYLKEFSDYGLVFNAERNNYPSYERVATTQTMKGVASTPELIEEWKGVRDEDDRNTISSFHNSSWLTFFGSPSSLLLYPHHHGCKLGDGTFLGDRVGAVFGHRLYRRIVSTDRKGRGPTIRIV